MTTSLARQIEARMKAMNISILALERMACLKGHGVRNIVRGKSKKPSAESLLAISEILHCTVKDLLSHKDLFPDDENIPSREMLKKIPYKHNPLLTEITTFVMDNSKKGGKEKNICLTIHQALTSIEEIFFHTIQYSKKSMDQNFAEWFLALFYKTEVISEG